MATVGGRVGKVVSTVSGANRIVRMAQMYLMAIDLFKCLFILEQVDEKGRGRERETEDLK